MSKKTIDPFTPFAEGSEAGKAESKPGPFTPVAESELPSDEGLYAIAKGTLLAAIQDGTRADQIRSAALLCTLMQRALKDVKKDVDNMSDEELDVEALEAQAALGGKR